jgi:hypothetical protein
MGKKSVKILSNIKVQVKFPDESSGLWIVAILLLTFSLVLVALM